MGHIGVSSRSVRVPEQRAPRGPPVLAPQPPPSMPRATPLIVGPSSLDLHPRRATPQAARSFQESELGWRSDIWGLRLRHERFGMVQIRRFGSRIGARRAPMGGSPPFTCALVVLVPHRCAAQWRAQAELDLDAAGEMAGKLKHAVRLLEADGAYLKGRLHEARQLLRLSDQVEGSPRGNANSSGHPLGLGGARCGPRPFCFPFPRLFRNW